MNWDILSRFLNVRKTLIVWMLLGILIGIIIGITMTNVGTYNERTLMLINFPANIFLRMIKFIALPLMGACLASAVGSLDRSVSVKLGIQFMICNIVLKFECALLGYFGTYPFKSARRNNKTMEHSRRKNATPVDNYLDLGRNIFADNIVKIFIYSYETELRPPTNSSDNNLYTWDVDGSIRSIKGPNMLGIVAVALATGFAIKKMSDSVEPFLKIIKLFSKIQFVIMNWIIYTSPVFLVFMMTGQLLEHDVVHIVTDLGLYLVAVILLYGLQFFMVYPLIYFAVARRNPYHVLNTKVILTAFSTGSSLATLPFAIEFLEDECHFDPRLVRFILPVGVNISKDGSALFYTIASHFVIFMENIEFNMGSVINLILLSVAGSMGTPGVPFGAMAVLVMVWVGCGINSGEYYATFLSVEWLRDRISTVINVYGNCYILGVLSHFNKKILTEVEDKDANVVREDDKDVETNNNI